MKPPTTHSGRTRGGEVTSTLPDMWPWKDRAMRTFVLKAAALTAFVLGSTLAADAATGPIGPLSAQAEPGSEELASRRCYWLNGVRYCRFYRSPPGYGYNGPHFPEAYPTGSQEMDRKDRGGRGGRR
jgi:hypothetical protein